MDELVNERMDGWMSHERWLEGLMDVLNGCMLNRLIDGSGTLAYFPTPGNGFVIRRISLFNSSGLCPFGRTWYRFLVMRNGFHFLAVLNNRRRRNVVIIHSVDTSQPKKDFFWSKGALDIFWSSFPLPVLHSAEHDFWRSTEINYTWILLINSTRPIYSLTN